MLKFETRPEPSRVMSIASPLLALAITVVVGIALFVILGKDPVKGLQVFFVEPVRSVYALSELAMKVTPLLLIALGLSVCFRSNVWNIGAEGQFIMGAVFAGGIAMQAGPATSHWIVVAILLAGVLGGMLWAGIVALGVTDFAVREDVARIAGEVGEVGGIARVGEGVEVDEPRERRVRLGEPLPDEIRANEAAAAGNQ